MSNWIGRALAEAVGGLIAHGILINSTTILSRANRLVVELEPCGFIAKIVPIEQYDRIEREVAVATHVAARHGPAAEPVPGQSLFRFGSVAVSLWHPLILVGAPTDVVVTGAYRELRDCLDTFNGELPDFREAIYGARDLANGPPRTTLSSQDAGFLRKIFDSTLKALEDFRWRPLALHGDPHPGNLMLAPEGLRWLEFESACSGPVEWDLTALPNPQGSPSHDPALSAVLMNLRRACVIAWCSAKKEPGAAESEAIAYHLEALRASRFI